jgi:hypothetical protein
MITHAVVALALHASTAHAAPATVLSHEVSVTIDGGRRLTEKVVWTVRVDDPAACAAGLIAPAGLDGAVDGGAMVLEDVLVVPPDAAAGDTFTLSATRKGGRGSHSGWLQSAPDLPVEQASLTVSAPGWVPLTVWADPGATPDYDIRSSRRTVTMTWRDVEAGERSRAAWSTFADWEEAAGATVASIDRRMASKNDLGREVAGDIEGLGVGGIVERAFDRVQLEPGPTGTWADALSAEEASEAKRGRAVDRAMLLLSLLRIAGMKATPGLFRPSTEEAFPVTVPAPSLLPRPMVVVHTDEGLIYVDPSAERAAVPARPASMLGATVWVPGQMPLALPERGIVDGAATVSTSVNVSGDGSATWSATIHSTGAATEYLRDLLAPLDEDEQREALLRLVKQSRPDTDRLEVKVSGDRRTRHELRITLSGFDEGALEQVGYGLRGQIAPTLAPALAAWLPPRVLVREQVSITPPSTVTILASRLAPSAFSPEAMVSRSYGREGPRAVIGAEVQRPYRVTSPAVDAAAAEFLEDQAVEGVELLLFTPASKATLLGIRDSPQLDEAEKAVLTAQLWWSEGNEKKATKALKKAVATVGFEQLLDGVVYFAQPGDLRPFEAMATVADDDAHQLLMVAEGLEAAGELREAWLAAVALHEAPDADVRVRSLLMAERLQPVDKPTGDPEGEAAWRSQAELINAAAIAATELPGGAENNDPRLLFRQAELALEEGKAGTAEGYLDEIEALGQGGPRVDVMRAVASAKAGLPRDEVTEQIESAVRQAPADPEVIAFAARATAEVGALEEAMAYALTAARIANDRPALWHAASERALSAADLATAAYAARRASDLEPADLARARWLRTLGILLADRELAELGGERAGEPLTGEWPPTLDERMAIAPAEALLALLDTAEQEVMAEPRMLAMRAQMRIDAGQLDAGARDGMALAQAYAWKEGWALAFAGTAGRQYSTVLRQELDKAASDQLLAQAVRMEYGLVTGHSDPLRDARSLDDDPRAQALLSVVSRPSESTSDIEGWPAEVPDPGYAPPKGYRVNKALSAVSGVRAYSSDDAATGILRVGAITGLLPPPLHQLYTVDPQPIERLANGGQVVRLDGGVMPLYAAVAFDGEHEVYGLGFSVEAAKLALADAMP